MTENTVLWLLGGIVSLIGWGFRVEMKIREHDKALVQIHDDMALGLEQVRTDVRYIRDRIDRVVDGR